MMKTINQPTTPIMSVKIGNLRPLINELAELKGWTPHKVAVTAIKEYIFKEIDKQKILKKMETVIEKEINKKIKKIKN